MQKLSHNMLQYLQHIALIRDVLITRLQLQELDSAKKYQSRLHYKPTTANIPQLHIISVDNRYVRATYLVMYQQYSLNHIPLGTRVSFTKT